MSFENRLEHTADVSEQSAASDVGRTPDYNMDKPGETELPNCKDAVDIADSHSMDRPDGNELPNCKDAADVADSRSMDRPSETELPNCKDAETYNSNIEKASDTSETDNNDCESKAQSEAHEEKTKEGLTPEQKKLIKDETGWSDEIIDHIENMDQYEALKKANLKEVEINGVKCLVKRNLDLDYKDEDGVTNRERMARGLAPLDSETGKPLELHHLGQKSDSPLVELTEEEHRTGEYKDGMKNQSLWHDNTKETEVHGEGNNWDQERKAHWKARAESN